MKSNIKDVAKLAGVSVGTVSRVINGGEGVAGSRIAAVKAAIAELGYQKNSVAQMLAGRRGGSRLATGNIGVWMPEMGNDWIANQVYSNYLGGIESVCARRGYHVLIEHGGTTNYPRCVHDGKVDGLIVKAINVIPEVLYELGGELPVVGLSMFDRRLPLPQVTTDNRLAGEEVCRYLWNKGHRRIAFASTNRCHQMFFDRRVGYEYFLSQHDAYDSKLDCALMLSDQNQPEENFPDMSPIVDMLFANLRPPTAIIAANDWMAAGLYEALFARNLRIPEDVSLVGFDHLPQLCLRPRLTSFAVPMYEMGRVAAELLLDRIAAGSLSTGAVPEFRMVTGQIVEHGSVATHQEIVEK